MKKLILLLSVFAVVLTSCGSDDDSSSQDPFIGIWTYHKTFINGVENALDDCSKQNKIIVTSIGSLTETYYDDFNGTCSLDAEDSATWVNLGNSTYKITYNEYNSFEGKITFEANTFFVETTDDYGGQTYTYKEVYIRN